MHSYPSYVPVWRIERNSNKQENIQQEINMHFKLILSFIEDDKTDAVMDAARKAGATGATIINNARGEGLEAHARSAEYRIEKAS